MTNMYDKLILNPMEGSMRLKHEKKSIKRVLLGAMIMCAVITLDSRYRIDMPTYEMFSARLPAGFDGFRILQISDLHGTVFGRGNSWLLQCIRRAEPDIIALTGDFIESENDIPVFEALAGEMARIAPVYFVSGNHDWSSGAIEELARALERQGVKYLRNEYLEIASGNDSIVLCGMEDPNSLAGMKKPDVLISELRGEYPDSYVVLLGHRNYWKTRYPELEVDVILCGHAHGGVVRLPLIGGVLGTNFDLFPDYTSGVYIGGKYDLIVSRGLGNSAPLPRFFNNPHLPIIVLRRSDSI